MIEALIFILIAAAFIGCGLRIFVRTRRTDWWDQARVHDYLEDDDDGIV